MASNRGTDNTKSIVIFVLFMILNTACIAQGISNLNTYKYSGYLYKIIYNEKYFYIYSKTIKKPEIIFKNDKVFIKDSTFKILLLPDLYPDTLETLFGSHRVNEPNNDYNLDSSKKAYYLTNFHAWRSEFSFESFPYNIRYVNKSPGRYLISMSAIEFEAFDYDDYRKYEAIPGFKEIKTWIGGNIFPENLKSKNKFIIANYIYNCYDNIDENSDTLLNGYITYVITRDYSFYFFSNNKKNKIDFNLNYKGFTMKDNDGTIAPCSP